MQDSNITFKVTTVGVEEATAKMDSLGATITKLTYNANGTVTASGKLTSSLNAQSNATSKAANLTDRASKSQESYALHIAKTTIQSALVNKAFLGIVDSASSAVTQVDLFQNFPASMQALGLSASDASASLIKLRDYAAQTGVNLTEATQSVTRFAEITKNVKAATAEYIGVKNALIAGGAGADQQKNALEQLTQAYARGKPQLIEFRSLQTAMPAQLTAVAKALNLPNTQALGEQLTAGKISMQEFITTLTKLGTGTGEIAKQTAAHMSGIAFSAGVMKNALTNAIAAIIQAIGRQTITSFLQFLTQVIQVTAIYTVALINDLISLFNWVSKVFGGPQIGHFAGDAAAASSALDDGAASAGDMADGLGDAADNAASVNKSLASFDKMNVLDKGKAAASPVTGQNGLDPADASALEDIFGKLGGGLQDASKWAKVLAGILAGLAGNALIDKLFGVNPLKGLIGGLGDAAKGFLGIGKSIEDTQSTADNAGDKIGKSVGTKIGQGAARGISGLSSAISGALGGIATVVGATVGPAIIDAFLAIGGAIAGALAIAAAAVGVSVGVLVLIVVAAVAIIAGIVYLIYTNWNTIWNAITTAFGAVVGALEAAWNTLFNIFKAPVEFILQFIQATFILIIAVVATALQLIFELVVGSVVLVYNVLAAVASWIYDNVVTPIANFFIALWSGIVTATTVAWDFILNTVLKPVATFVYNNVIAPIVGFFLGLYNSISGVFSGIFSNVVNILSPLGSFIYNNVILPIARFFQGMWDGIQTGLSNLFSALQNIFGSLGGIIKTPINGVIDLINDVLKGLNTIKVPSWVPKYGGQGVNFPLIPKLAKGGVVSQATTATIGENGAEAVVPLENNTEWIDTLASKINDKQGNGTPVQLVVQIGEDKIATKVIELINEKTNMSGRNTIYV